MPLSRIVLTSWGIPFRAAAKVLPPVVTQTGRGAHAQTPPRVRRIASVSALVGGSTSIWPLLENPRSWNLIPVLTSVILRFVLIGTIVLASDQLISSTLIPPTPNSSVNIKPSLLLCRTLDQPFDKFSRTVTLVFISSVLIILWFVDAPDLKRTPAAIVLIVVELDAPEVDRKSDLI